MQNSRPLTDLVRDFRASCTTVSERIDTLVFSGTFADAATQATWVAFSAMPPPSVTEIQVYDSEIGGDVGPNDSFDPERQVSLTIVKPSVAGVGCFFFQDSLSKYFVEGVDVAALRVADLPAEEAFGARGLEVTHWALDETLTQPPPPTVISPSKLVADHVPNREVPRDLSPWILLSPPAHTSVAFKAWRTVSARRLLSGLVSSVSLEEGVVWLQASGPPIFRISAEDPGIPNALEMLTEVATWVFLSGSDIEARHRLFCGELARAERTNQDFVTTLSHAFDAAKVAYDAHVQSASRETLKVLADLRKTVIEETQRVTQRAQDMTAGLARDLAVSATPFVLKILADVGKVTAPGLSATFYFAAAAFLVASFGLQWRINNAYLRSQKQSRKSWMQTLYTYISSKEREEIAELPIQQAIQNYRETRAILLGIYLVLVASLVGVGGYTLVHVNATSVEGSPQATEQVERPSFQRTGPTDSISNASSDSSPVAPLPAPGKGSR